MKTLLKFTFSSREKPEKKHSFYPKRERGGENKNNSTKCFFAKREKLFKLKFNINAKRNEATAFTKKELRG